MLNKLKKQLKKIADANQAKISQGFFKTGKGEYGEGDIFLGIKVPVQRQVAKSFYELDLDSLQELLNSNIHEHRFISLVILLNKHKKANEKQKQDIFDFYIKNAHKINNWDLVDSSAPNILGDYLLKRDKKILYKLVRSENLWEKRISIISTYAFIRKNEFADTLKISEMLLSDSHDLIHKAVGWMLREIGNRNQKIEEEFLKKHYKKMPRTMLRYAIEKFPEDLRKKYLRGDI